jgi:hypothetical protein
MDPLAMTTGQEPPMFTAEIALPAGTAIPVLALCQPAPSPEIS